jgi:thiopeptide-type bacteriocin biosynthesis protein
VFARAAWRVTRDEIGPLVDTHIAGSEAAQYQAVQRWRAGRRLPRWVVLTDYDNTLPIDLDNALAVDALLQLLKGRESATLTEMYPGPDELGELCAEGDDGRYTHELLIPCIVRPTAAPVAAPISRRRRAISIRRTFEPGSEWVFAKLYTSASAADRLLSQTIGPVSQALLSKGLIDRWFFVRYADPDEHLRWRLHATATTRGATIQRRIERVVTKALGDGLVRRLVFDTYEREVERYGGEAGIEAAERYFWADSEAVVRLLDPVRGVGASPDLRWQAAIPGIDTLLSDLGFDLDAKFQLTRKLRGIFGREFHADAAFARQLGARYRAVRPDLQRLLDRTASGTSPAWLDAFACRSTRTRDAVAALRGAQDSESLDVSIAVLAESYVHMHLNRLFRAEQRAQELVVYDFLSCLYESGLARRGVNDTSRGSRRRK